uniref:Mic1 domain-containing protein n=2 Tax=Chrysotila carterae TaxID=13221 RepID=A0A7S4B4V8_CHRCT
MLERLGESEETHDAVMRLLLKQGKLLSCCRFIRQHRLFAYPPRTVLAAAAASDDRLLFRAIYLFFLQRNEVWRGSADFVVAEDCEEFTALFQQRESTEAAAARGL